MHILDKSFECLSCVRCTQSYKRTKLKERQPPPHLLNLRRRDQIYVVVFSDVIHRLVSEQGLSVCQYPNLDLPELKSGTVG